MFVYNWELHWKIVDWDILDRHYDVIIVTIITENYRLPLHSGHLLGYRRPQMKPDHVHWGVGPTWVAVRVNYKWCTQNLETVFEHPALPLRLGCNDI